MLLLLLGAVCLNKACKEDVTLNNTKLNSRVTYPCEGQGSATCDTVVSCAYSSPCCSTRQDLIRSNYSTSLEFAKAVARELEKVMQGCVPPNHNQYCYTDNYCVEFNSKNRTDIRDFFGSDKPTFPFHWCTHNNSTASYNCGNFQYNVDIPIALQDLMISFILGQFNDPDHGSCPTGYTKSLYKVDMSVCKDNSINCVEFPYCSNMFLTAEYTYTCCNNSQGTGQ